jgi:predicted PurR-regulated permease PerM
MKEPATDVKIVRFELAPRTIGWIAAAAAGLWLIYKLWIILVVIVVALVLVGTFNPIIERMEARGHKRANAMLLLMLGLGLASTALLFLSVPALLEQLTRIVADLPEQRERLILALGKRHLTAPLGQALNNVGLEQAFARLQAVLVDCMADAVGVVVYGITTFFLSLYLLLDGKRTKGALYAIVPRDYHMKLARIIHNLGTIVGGYMRGQLITSVSIATFAFLLLRACGVRNALALALLTALADVLPFIGGMLATSAVVLTALGRGPTTAAVVLAAMLVYIIFESKILVPRVYGRALRLSPAAVVLALIAGGTLLGMMGALLALPMAAGLQMIIKELGVDMPGDDSDDPTERARDQGTEDAYKLMSAGSSAPDAGQIANDLAQDIRDADAWVAANQAKKKSS